MHDDHVKQGKAIQRETGKTFHIATRLLPERIRHPTYVLYGFFRLADEIVDDPDGPDPAEQTRQLDALRAQALGEEPAEDPVVDAFATLRETHGIDDEWVEAFVDAMAADVHTDTYDTYADLAAYMRGSAAAVGVMMTDVMGIDAETDATDESTHTSADVETGVDGETVRGHAIALGEAFQLTNFCRDVREDVVDRDRVYLPVETLHAHGATVADVKALEATPEVKAAIAAETTRAEDLYRDGVRGIKYLPRDCQFAVLLAAVLYAEHHRVIRARGFDTVSADVDLPTWRKLACVAKTAWAWWRNPDPEAVFERVSAVPSRRDDDYEATAGGHGTEEPGGLGDRVLGWLPSR
jgi:phytoene synthase